MRLSKDEDLVRVKDTFQQVNRHGKQLTDFDMLNAVVAINGLSPRDLAADSHAQLQKAGLNVPAPNVETLVTKIMLLRVHPSSDQDADVEQFLVPGERAEIPADTEPRVLIPSSADFKSLWQSATNKLTAGLRTLRDESRCSDDDAHHKYAPEEALVPNYCALLADAGDDPVKKRKLHQWYWASLLMQRYEDIPKGDPRKGEDYHEVLRWFESDTQRDEDAPGVVREFTDSFNPRRSHGMTRHDSRGLVTQSAAATNEGGEPPPPQAGAVLSLLRRRNPYDWRTGDYVRGAGHVVEAYIVPLSRCDAMGIAFSNSRSVFNSLLVSDEMLADIGDEMPHVYLPKVERRWRRRGWATDKLDSVLRSHFLTSETARLLKSRQFTERTFEEFLDKRRSEIFRSFGQDLYNVDLGLDPSDREFAGWLDRIETRLKQVLIKFLAQEDHNLWERWHPRSPMWRLEDDGVFRDAEQHEREARLAFLESAMQRERLSLFEVGMAVADQFDLIRDRERWRPDAHRGRFSTHIREVAEARNLLYHPPPNWTQTKRQRYSTAAREILELLSGA